MGTANNAKEADQERDEATAAAQSAQGQPEQTDDGATPDDKTAADGTSGKKSQ